MTVPPPSADAPSAGPADVRHVELRPGAYADSVTLLQVSRAVQGLDGVLAAQVAMATGLNVEVLAQMGFAVPPEATTNDMVVALRLTDAAALDDALAGVDRALHEASHRPDAGEGSGVAPARTTASALRRGPDGLALVSVPGASALVEAMDALDAGRDVMIFSDNVPLEQELALKRTATARGLLVMGPDCGTAVVGGVGLGFANAVLPGPVGLVAASGTGCQQLLALLDHAGVGVTSALGVGGRDLSADVRGLSTREALRRLDADPAVELVVIVSKPPDDDVAAEVRSYADGLDTPVELALLGRGQPDLTAAAEAVLVRLGHDVPAWPSYGEAAPATTGRALRGLFVGGTLCDEAMLVATEVLGPVHSNIPLSPELALGPDLAAPAGGAGHTMVDFGDDALTAGRAHPMIDPTLRLEHLARVAADDDTAVVLLDVVLGHGSEPDPAALLGPAIAAVRQPVVVAVVGTDADPQGLGRQVDALVAAGAEVHLSNARATRRALELMEGLR
jgi:FdrA protein